MKNNIFVSFILNEEKTNKNLFLLEMEKGFFNALEAKHKDRFLILWPKSNNTRFHFLKCDSGYLPKKNTKTGLYEISINLDFKLKDEFIRLNCAYFINKNKTITVMLN